MNETEHFEFEELKRQVEDLRFLLARKTGIGSADIKANIISPSTVGGTVSLGSASISSAGMFATGVVDQAATGSDAVGQSELKEETATVTINAGSPSGTAVVTSGNIILGWYPNTNLDQIIDDISISGTTLTVTLAANATATTTIKVVMLKT